MPRTDRLTEPRRQLTRRRIHRTSRQNRQLKIKLNKPLHDHRTLRVHLRSRLPRLDHLNAQVFLTPQHRLALPLRRAPRLHDDRQTQPQRRLLQLLRRTDELTTQRRQAQGIRRRRPHALTRTAQLLRLHRRRHNRPGALLQLLEHLRVHPGARHRQRRIPLLHVFRLYFSGVQVRHVEPELLEGPRELLLNHAVAQHQHLARVTPQIPRGVELSDGLVVELLLLL